MAVIQLLRKAGSPGQDDLALRVQDRTFDYLMDSTADEIRVSAFLEQDCPRVEDDYEELFVAADCPFVSKIDQLIPGSRTRKGIQLPGPMHKDEQLTIVVARSPRDKGVDQRPA